MSNHRLIALAAVCLGILVLPACGGGGEGLRVESDPVLVTSTSVPPMMSGEVMDHVIPLQGGCGGPYVLKVIEGRMPDGLELDDDTHSIRGGILEDGDFEFTIQVTDTGCDPFSATTATFQMSVGVGDVKVVGATRDGNPVLIPAGGDSYNPDYPSIGKTVYNDYATIELVVAGGKGPYTAVIFDDPTIPNDGPLPLGASVPPGSTSINGAPVEVGPGGGPFLITVEITDSLGEKGYFTFYWLIETPPIIFATDAWGDGQAGVTYSEQVFVAEGVPPFAYEFVAAEMPAGYTSAKADDPGLDPNTNVIYNAGGPPTVTPAGALTKIDASYYPDPALNATIPGVPPEGAALNEESGAFSGIPRRLGSYEVYVHVQSTLVPNSFGQHAWGSLDFFIAGAPPLELDPAFTLGTSFAATEPYTAIAEALKGEIYNPDGGPNGLQLLANGGVADDGNTDAPHVSQYAPDPAETPGAYKWAIDWNPDGVPGQGPIPAMELVPGGVFRVEEIGGVPQVDSLIPQFDQAIAFTAADSALPTSLAGTSTERVAFGVGPDRILVTQSNTSMSNSTDNRSWDDTAMNLKYVIPSGSAYTLRVPNDTDLTGDGADKHTLPSEAGSATAGTMFANMDLLRVSINPTGYWDDNVYLNPNAARPWQNSQSEFYYPYYGPGANGTTSYSSSGYTYAHQPSTACVKLPKCSDSSVVASKSEGVYTDGGKLHVFDTSTHFGVFIVRKDGRIFVPAAFQRSTSGYYSFGDNWSYGHRSAGSTHSSTRLPQMTVSPDGRFAALKLRTSSSYSRTEYAYLTDILLISLTGERIAAWGDEAYTIIGAGPTTSSSSYGLYLYASSLTLTNDHLYYIVGNSTSYAHFRDHYIYRYELDGGASSGSFLHSNFNSEWTNSAGSPMQVPFQVFNRNFTTSTSTGAPDPVMYSSNGYNSWEMSTAPHPFRVNRDGNACAILAGLNTTATTSAASNVLWHHVWVDFEGDLHQLSTQRRHTSGGGRGVRLASGPSYGTACSMWGDYNGPQTRFEISDDGLKVAVVYYRNTSVDPYTDYNDYVYRYREDIAAYTSTDDSWTGRTVHEVTGDSSTNTGYSSSYVGGAFGYTSSSYDHAWRFGALTFTMAGDGLVFWGGKSSYDPDGYSQYYYRYSSCKSFVGSLYSYNFSTGNVRSILAASDGGCNKTIGSIINKPNFSPSTWQTDGGLIKPVAGFRSGNGNFLYISTRGATGTSSSRQRDNALIGVNVRSLNTSASINGNTDGRAFYVDGFGTRNGFLSGHYYYSASNIGQYSYSSNYQHYYSKLGYGDRVVADDTGWVYFTSVTASTSLYSSTSSSYGGPIRATYGLGYVYYPKVIYGFDPNIGGDLATIGGPGWTGGSYQHVQGLVVSDDGSTVTCVDSTYTSYHYLERERFTVFSDIEFDPNDGDLNGSVTRQQFENLKAIGDCSTISPKGDAVYYASGSSATGQSLTVGEIGGTSTGSSLGLPSARWAVIHAGR